ncbi:DDB1- and CUL4-associated factor 4 [Pelobates fuscus]|uniref:DDB1- and CUL4-associated factor 4 n=1 Tax=Pelobates fuscus TaxID=191477 RepID=UPI002FE46A21
MGPKRTNWKRRRPYQHRRPSDSVSAQTSNAGCSSSSSAAAASSSSSSSSSSVPELPGFYYDPEKNRYFRMLPGHNNCNPLTKEMLQRKQMELERLKMLKEEENRIKSTRPGLNASMLVLKRSVGMIPSTTYCRRMHELKMSCMMSRKVHIDCPEEGVETGQHPFELMLADSNYKSVFTVNDADNGFCKFGLLSLNGLWKESPTVKSYDTPYFANQKVNAACWATMTATDSHILVCHQGKQESPGCVSLIPACLLKNMEANSDGRPELFYKVKISNTWSCAWSYYPYQTNNYAVGLRQQILLVNIVKNFRQAFKTESDVLAQQFATQSGLLYNGGRSGEVFAVDLRLPSNPFSWKKAISFHHRCSISSLRLLQDENYLMVSDMSGKIKLWDIRNVRPVKHYEGHNNSYALLPLHVKEDEGLLLAVGQDCYTRIWNLEDTRLLRTIPSPHPASKDSIPNVVFSPYLGGKHQMVPGLLMAVEKELYHFSYNFKKS